MSYVLVTWSNKAEVERRNTRMHVGGDLLPGWHEGLPGVRRGDRRLLVVPQDTVGEKGRERTVDTSVYVIDVFRVES